MDSDTIPLLYILRVYHIIFNMSIEILNFSYFSPAVKHKKKKSLRIPVQFAQKWKALRLLMQHGVTMFLLW
jgi:hypothetical protein